MVSLLKITALKSVYPKTLKEDILTPQITYADFITIIEIDTETAKDIKQQMAEYENIDFNDDIRNITINIDIVENK
jgi:hypothetical protein